MHANCFDALHDTEPTRKSFASDELENSSKVHLAVWGMNCQNCAARVRNSLLALSGVLDADVSHSKGVALVAYNPELVSTEALLQAVTQAGDGNHHEYIAMLLE